MNDGFPTGSLGKGEKMSEPTTPKEYLARAGKTLAKGIAKIVAVIFALFAVIWIGGELTSGDSSKKSQQTPSATISKEQFGTKWPLKVNNGIVKCLPIGKGSVVFEAGGKTYAVNGTAKGFAKKHGFYPIEGIWLNDPEFHKAAKEIADSEKKPIEEVIKAMGTPPKLNISPILNAGLKLCK